MVLVLFLNTQLNTTSIKMVKTYDEKLKEKKDKLRTFSDGTSLGDMQARLEAIELRLEEAGL